MNTHTAPLYLNATVAASPSIEKAGFFEVAWGEGTFREYFLTQPRLAALLVTAPTETTFAGEAARLAQGIGVELTEAEQLLQHLTEYGLYRTEPRDLTAAEERWLDVSWHDALDLHLATHDMKWIHDYTGNPQVMTKYHIDKRVEPTTPPPTRFPPPATTATVALPARKPLDMPYQKVQLSRRTKRNFKGSTIELDDIATILDWSFRPQWPDEDPRYYATQTYSRGAPFVAFCIFGQAGAPAEVEQDFSVYQYDPERHLLALRSPSHELSDWKDILWEQSYADGAPFSLVIAADWQQYMWKYRFSRAYRWAYYECGAVMQTALSVATGLGIDAFQTPAIDDARVCEMLGVSDTEIGPIYLASFGRK
jgi:hypothetical protein